MNQRNLGGIELDTPQILGIFVGQEFDWQHPLAWTVTFFFLHPISSRHPASQPFICIIFTHLYTTPRRLMADKQKSPFTIHHFVLGRLRPTWSWHRAAARWRQKSFRSWKNRRNARVAMPPARLRRYLCLRSYASLWDDNKWIEMVEMSWKCHGISILGWLTGEGMMNEVRIWYMNIWCPE